MKKKTILFTPYGSTDPIKNGYDGPILQIIRKKKPDEVCIFLSKAMNDQNKVNHGVEYLEKFVQKQINPDTVFTVFVDEEMDKPHHPDLVYDSISRKLREVEEKHPEDEIVLNLSSGTPAMQMVLTVEALNPRYNLTGMIVSNPEPSEFHKSEPDLNLNISEELENSMDNLDEALNRATPIENTYMDREQKKKQLERLIENYEYDSVLQLESILPQSVVPLVKHLAARKKLDTDGARRALKSIKEVDLFPSKEYVDDQLSKKEIEDKKEKGRNVAEYFMTVKMLVKMKNLDDFVLHLNPLILAIEEEMIKDLFSEFAGIPRAKVFKKKEQEKKNRKKKNRKTKLNTEIIQEYAPDAIIKINQEFWKGYSDRDISLRLTTTILKYFQDTYHVFNGQEFDQIRNFKKVNDLRNEVAHSLFRMTEEDFIKKSDYTPEEMISFLENKIQEVYPNIPAKALRVYDNANRWIIEQIRSK